MICCMVPLTSFNGPAINPWAGSALSQRCIFEKLKMISETFRRFAAWQSLPGMVSGQAAVGCTLL